MVAYHIDRKGTLNDNMTINLITEFTGCQYLIDNCLERYPDGLSSHGQQYLLSDKIIKSRESSISTIHELILENIRENYYPHMPSRFQSFFAFPKESFAYWSKMFGDNYKIFEVEFNNNILLDANFYSNTITSSHKLDGTPIADWDKSGLPSITKSMHLAHHYWNQKRCATPLLEYLCKPPINIIREIKTL